MCPSGSICVPIRARVLLVRKLWIPDQLKVGKRLHYVLAKRPRWADEALHVPVQLALAGYHPSQTLSGVALA